MNYFFIFALSKMEKTMKLLIGSLARVCGLGDVKHGESNLVAAMVENEKVAYNLDSQGKMDYLHGKSASPFAPASALTFDAPLGYMKIRALNPPVQDTPLFLAHSGRIDEFGPSLSNLPPLMINCI